MKTIVHCMEAAGLDARELARRSGVDARLVKTIVTGNYTPSPEQRQSLAAALGVTVDEVSWEHTVPVEHMRGNGPQFGRST